jgi:predicted DNA-binding transcriptional regulator
MNTGVYRITCTVNGKCYIGSTGRSFSGRWKSHLNLLRRKLHHSVKLQRAWDKYGEDSFEFAVVIKCKPEDAVKNEQICFDTMKPEYNVSSVAANGSLGCKHSDEARLGKSRRMRHGPDKYLVRGEWLSIFEISEKYNILAGTLVTRVNRGELGESLISPIRAPNTGKGSKFLVHGEVLTTREISTKYNIPKQTLQKRIKTGVTGDALAEPSMAHEDIVKLSIAKRSDNFRRLLVRGEELTVSEIMSKYGLTKPTVNSRIANGLTGDDLIKPPKKMNNDTAKRHLVNGEELTVREICQKYHLSEVTVRGRVMVGWSGDALALPADRKNRPTRAA